MVTRYLHPSVCTNQIICIRRLKVTGDKYPNIVVCEDIGLKILFAMYNHHNLAKENRSEQEILVAGTQFAQNNKHLFKELSHQNEHLQRK